MPLIVYLFSTSIHYLYGKDGYLLHSVRVQIHDSYRFVSKSYHSMKYHFKSIDTWLNGVCRRSVWFAAFSDAFCAKIVYVLYASGWIYLWLSLILVLFGIKFT